MPPPPPPLSVSVLTGFACIIYLFIICCFAHSHRRNDHFKVKSERLLKLERGEAPWWLECVILPTAREGGRGLRSVEMENKPTKIKGAVRICCYGDPAIQIVREFEERSKKIGRRSMLKKRLGLRSSYVSSLISNIPLQSRKNCESVK